MWGIDMGMGTGREGPLNKSCAAHAVVCPGWGIVHKYDQETLTLSCLALFGF